MSLKTKVKVGNITNLSDARYCAGMGVDMLGFKINEMGNHGISTTRFKEIATWVSGPEFVLELSEFPADLKEVNEIGFIELHARLVNELATKMYQGQTIITIEAKDWSIFKKDLLSNRHKIKYLLMTNSSGLETNLIKDYVKQMANDFDVLFGTDIKVNSLEEYLTWPIAGLALNGSEETSPGIKDYDHLSSILEKLEAD